MEWTANRKPTCGVLSGPRYFSVLAVVDLVHATDIARQTLTRCRMHEILCLSTPEHDRGGFLGKSRVTVTPSDHAEATARKIDLAVRGFLNTAIERANSLLKACHTDLAASAKHLMQHAMITPAKFPSLRQQEAIAV